MRVGLWVSPIRAVSETNRQAPRQTSMQVRSPAGFWCHCRSTPTAAPSRAATARFREKVSSSTGGLLPGLCRVSVGEGAEGGPPVDTTAPLCTNRWDNPPKARAGMPPDSADVTTRLERFRAGDTDARHHLVERLYEELHQLAGRLMRAEAPGHTLQPTALLHEAFDRLFHGQAL